MEIKGCVGLVTGGNRGIGEAFVRVLLESAVQYFTKWGWKLW